MVSAKLDERISASEASIGKLAATADVDEAIAAAQTDLSSIVSGSHIGGLQWEPVEVESVSYGPIDGTTETSLHDFIARRFERLERIVEEQAQEIARLKGERT